MGLDISIGVDNTGHIYTPDYYLDEISDYRHKHSLSRTFCNFMCRKNIVEEETELDQIGRITSIDISPIYQMENYGMGSEELEFFLETAETEAEKQKIIERDIQNKKNWRAILTKCC